MEKLAVVVDTNVVFAALVKSEGLNRYVVTVLPAIFPFFYPKKLKEEIFKHIRKISSKAGLQDTQTIYALRSVLSGIKLIHTQQLARKRKEALGFVKDPDDWAYVASALYLRKKYENVLILTWNKKHFVADKLEKRNIYVVTPDELLRALRLRYIRKAEKRTKKVRGLSFKIYRILVSVIRDEDK